MTILLSAWIDSLLLHQTWLYWVYALWFYTISTLYWRPFFLDCGFRMIKEGVLRFFSSGWYLHVFISTLVVWPSLPYQLYSYAHIYRDVVARMLKFGGWSMDEDSLHIWSQKSNGKLFKLGGAISNFSEKLLGDMLTIVFVLYPTLVSVSLYDKRAERFKIGFKMICRERISFY